MIPFHHGDGTSDGNALEQFNDSEGGVFLANVLHSAGALCFTAGIVIYLYLAHQLRRAGGPKAVPHPDLLTYGYGFTIGGIALNGIGGLMRLYESDHPGLDRLGDSTWVQVLLVKHLFLFAGVGLAVWVTLRTRHMHEHEASPAAWERESPRITAFSVGSLASILLATLLGAQAANVDLNADLGIVPSSDAGDGNPPPAPEPGPPPIIDRFSTQGRITGSPAAPGAIPNSFTVDNLTGQIEAVVTWTNPLAILTLGAFRPDGSPASGDLTTDGQQVRLAIDVANETPGAWVIEVRSERAVEEPYTFTYTAFGIPILNTIERTITVAGGGAFFEANLNMDAGANLSYEWRVMGSDAIAFNIHVHFESNGSVLYPVEGNWNSLSGNYSHDYDTVGPSLMWENDGTVPLQVHYRVWGDFTVDSYFPSPNREVMMRNGFAANRG